MREQYLQGFSTLPNFSNLEKLFLHVEYVGNRTPEDEFKKKRKR